MHIVTVLFYFASLTLCVEGETDYYLGHSLQEITASGTDILALELLKHGEPDFAQVAKVLPPITKGDYTFLSGAASWGSVIIDKSGNLFPHRSGLVPKPDQLFSPESIDAELGKIPPKQHLLNSYLPMLVSRHSKDDRSLELLYFVEPLDPDRDPLVWIRSTLTNADGSTDVKYQVASASRGKKLKPISAERFDDTYQLTVDYWEKFHSKTALFQIPNELLSRVGEGAMIAMAQTFSGDHAHYGHHLYGMEISDNFPPNCNWAIEACCLTGRFDLARRYLDHLLMYGIDQRGRYVYYQEGEDETTNEIRSSSAADYSLLLFLIDRYGRALQFGDWGKEHLPKLVAMGEELLSYRVECPELEQQSVIPSGTKLIKMCAEADTNGRDYVYLNNNLWAVRGLTSLANTLKQLGEHGKAAFFVQQSEDLLNTVRKVLPENTVTNNYGTIVPFRLGYAALPLTLSNCNNLLEGLSPEEKKDYLQRTWVRNKTNKKQDLTENTYANYRYYPEMLSSMLLSEEQAASLVRMREDRGGELLAMTRLHERIDNWPVVHYARYLIESGRIDKYLLLLYAHTLYHGVPDKMCYSEQVYPNGKWGAADCIPSLLTTPIMLSWTFAYETMPDAQGKQQLQLLRAVPQDWYNKGFAAHSLGCSDGKLDLDVEADDAAVTISGHLTGGQFSVPVVLYTRFNHHLQTADILEGLDHIEKIEGDRITLKKEMVQFSLKIRRTKTQNEYTVTTIDDNRITLDGKGSEPVWNQAVAISFTNPWDKEHNPATSLKLLSDSKSLYFCFEVQDSDIVLEPDFMQEKDVMKEDRVELFFSKDNKMNDYNCLEIDPKGRILSYRAAYYRNIDFDWTPPAALKTAAEIRPDGYCVEGAVPLEFVKEFSHSDNPVYFGAYRAEFSRKDGKVIENWQTWI
ncbi:MAG: carbohydrate-binding family 9-like protein, partial [Planctomycetaceae bacterium]|nr:carbohydrate-binding family 9-like protein [Planctomycetaceae bacterium]